MSVLMPTPAPSTDSYDRIAVLATPATLAVLRSMSDGQWATVAQITEATGATEQQVHDAFSVLSERCLENLGELYRMNCDSVRDNLAAIAASFGATLVSRD